ncbi:glycosyltransferase family 2 protein [Pelagibacterales bacterium SAG-MED10]|nr:glycosyltransferase family 2 protein [Pelagibacterales bacterium SAG-MED10]
MKVSIIIPCYNELNFLNLLIERVLEQKNINKEIILIDDFSNDGTRNLIKNSLSKKVTKVIYNEKNYGKGYCIRKGIIEASGEVILIQDADLEYSPYDYEKLLKPIFEGHADAVYGSRFKSGEITRVLYFWHSLGNKFLTLLSNMLTNFNLTDMENCYKVFKSEILKNIELKENRFGFEPEITAKLSKLNDIRLFEVSTKYYGRTYKEGKKITWKDGFVAIYCIIKYKIFN